jgi:hypothetical protein
MAGPAGFEPTTLVSKTKMISISPRTDYSFGIPRGIRTPTIGFGDRHATVNIREIKNLCRVASYTTADCIPLITMLLGSA